MWGTQEENGAQGLDLTQRRPSPKPAAGFDYFVARLRLENTVNSREYHVEKRWEDKQGGQEEKLQGVHEEREL